MFHLEWVKVIRTMIVERINHARNSACFPINLTFDDSFFVVISCITHNYALNTTNHSSNQDPKIFLGPCFPQIQPLILQTFLHVFEKVFTAQCWVCRMIRYLVWCCSSALRSFLFAHMIPSLSRNGKDPFNLLLLCPIIVFFKLTTSFPEHFCCTNN